MNKHAFRRVSSGKGLVCGVGIYEPQVLSMADAPHVARVYGVWNHMLTRAEPKYSAKYPSYAGTSVAPTFHRFAEFATWAMDQIGWDLAGYQLDKDLILKGNRVYSPDTCVFVPKAINMVLTKSEKLRGEFPIGVKPQRYGRFSARIKIDSQDTYLGTFSTPGEAFSAYKFAKESNIKRLAELYRLDIDPRAYAALMAYTVEITD